MFKKVAIIGVGLIGGSLAMAIKKAALAREIIGVTRHRSTLKKAKSLGVIDSGTLEPSKAAIGADLVIIATPVADIPRIAASLVGRIKEGAIVTDVGSTKSKVVSQVEKMFPDRVYFVGGHPMAGSEQTGVAQARADLFKDAVCFLTRTRLTNHRALGRIRSLWFKIGARVKIVSPTEHDRIVAQISHLPHLLAFNLAAMVPSQNLDYAAGGFSDTTRIASGDPIMWKDIYLTNSEELIKALDCFIESLKKTKRLILRREAKKILAQLKRAKGKRDAYGRR